MTQVKCIDGNLLDANTKYIAHQTNCISRGNHVAGIAAAIFYKYPYSDIYKIREEDSEPGTISVHGNGDDERFVINMNSQFFPGAHYYSTDQELDRISFFSKALSSILEIENLETIAFPSGIGCGLAKGNWKIYFELIDTFAKHANKQDGTETYIYYLNDMFEKF